VWFHNAELGQKLLEVHHRDGNTRQPIFASLTDMMKSIRQNTHKKSLFSEEPDEAKVSCPVREWRWGA